MIPKLCTEITDTNGLGRLADAISVSITQEVNGAYELTMKYPVTGELYDSLANDLLIGTRTGDDSGVQYFRIVRISRPINGVVTVYAQHYSYQLNYIHVPPGTYSDTVENVLTALVADCIETCPFTLTTDIDTTMTLVVEKPTSLRSVIGGMDSSIVELLGAEILWDNDTVTITSALVPTTSGTKNVALRYGKNLKELEVEDSIEEFYTGVLPYWAKDVDDVAVYVQGDIQYSDAQGTYDYERILALDLTSEFDDQPTAAQLNAAAVVYITTEKIGVLTPSITATPAQLWRTAEGAKFEDIESLQIGSQVDIIYNKLGVNTTAEVIETTYDGLRERYTSMTLGAPRANIASNVASMSGSTSSSSSSSSSGSGETYALSISSRTITLNGSGGTTSSVTVPETDLTDYYTSDETDDLLAAKQASLTFDSTPTNGSSNPVTSDGIYDALAQYADYVVSYGTSGNWTYRLWNSGISECWGYYDVSSVACTTASGSLYVTGAISPSMAFPDGVFLSGSHPTVSMTFHSSQGYPAFVWIAASSYADTGATPFRLMRPTSATISGRMEYIYKGRWK